MRAALSVGHAFIFSVMLPPKKLHYILLGLHESCAISRPCSYFQRRPPPHSCRQMTEMFKNILSGMFGSFAWANNSGVCLTDLINRVMLLHRLYRSNKVAQNKS